MATEDARKLFMAGLPDSVTEEVLRGLFVETGAQVTELTVPRDRATGRPRGFAFVRLGSQDEADRARQELDGRIVDGKMISVRPFHADPPPGGVRVPGDRPPRPDGAGPGGPGMGGGVGGGFSERPRGPGGGGAGAGPGAPDRTLYVGNLPYDAVQEEVDGLIRNAGIEGVARVHLPIDQDGRKRGFGFVTMVSAEAANAALEALKGADIRGRRLIVNIAHPKGERPARPDGPGPGGPGGPPGGFDRPPRTFGPPAGGFAGGGGGGGGPPPPARSGKGEGRKRKFDENEKTAAAAAKGKRDKEERWRDEAEDDDW